MAKQKTIAEPTETVVDMTRWFPRAEAVINQAISDQPQLKEAIVNLIRQASIVVGDFSTDISEKTLNLQHDLQTLKDAEIFFLGFKNQFIPLVAQIYNEVGEN